MVAECLGLFVSLSALAFWPPPTEGAIRCYCNSEQCAATGFACVSHANRCFSKLYYSNETADIHGCLDALPDRQRGICDGYRSGDLVKASETGDALIMCCLDDLCNYKATQDALIDVAKVNASFGSDGVTPPRGRSSGGGEHAGAGGRAHVGGGGGGSTTESWFTATVIAVPIVGGLILIVLVLVAVRMLQYDSRSSARQQRGAAKARLYIDSHFASGAYCLHGGGGRQPPPPPPCKRSSSDNVVTQADCWDDFDSSTCSTRDYEVAGTGCGATAASAGECSRDWRPAAAVV